MTDPQPAPTRARPARRLPARLLAAWALLLAGSLGCLLVRDRLEMMAWCNLCGLTLFSASKAAMLLRLDSAARRRLSLGSLVAYLLWVGMRTEPFQKGAPDGSTPRRSLWLTGLVNLTAGAVLFWGVPLLLPDATPFEVRIGIAVTGFGLMFLFAGPDWWAALYRRLGFPVEKLWDNPPAAVSLADFWGNRWNRIFSGFARDLFFLPLARVAGARLASLSVFLFAGLLHEWAWSAAVREGYGLPTLYFVIQALGIQAESTTVGRRVIRGRPLVGRLWTWLVVLGPVPLLFHATFLHGYVAPYLTGLGVRGL
jgi:alginate O-acetyltransferase complex protein AlgI